MKRIYNKPIMLVETFAMTQSVAHNCGDNLDFDMAMFQYKSTCAWNVGGVAVFTTGVTGCTTVVPPDAEIGGICYDNPSENMAIFGS